MKSIQAVALSTLLSLASAQYAIDPKSVPEADRKQWCLSQETACPLICLNTAANSAETNTNQCDAATLTFACVCSNGLSPNISEYSQTLPFYICQTWGQQCRSNCNGNTQCQTDCVVNHPCGAQNPKRVNTTASASSSAASSTTNLVGATSASGGVVFTGLGGSGPASTQGAAVAAQSAGAAAGGLRAAALSAGQTFGLLGVAGVLFGGFAVLL